MGGWGRRVTPCPSHSYPPGSVDPGGGAQHRAHHRHHSQHVRGRVRRDRSHRRCVFGAVNASANANVQLQIMYRGLGVWCHAKCYFIRKHCSFVRPSLQHLVQTSCDLIRRRAPGPSPPYPAAACAADPPYWRRKTTHVCCLGRQGVGGGRGGCALIIDSSLTSLPHDAQWGRCPARRRGLARTPPRTRDPCPYVTTVVHWHLDDTYSPRKVAYVPMKFCTYIPTTQ
jgi:hypothetical protein